MGRKKAQVVGYRYYMGIHAGICRGPVDELCEIKVGDRTVWSGSVTTTQSIFINAPDIFGGDQREGGVQGTMDVLMGAPSQTATPGLARMLGGLVPGFRGVATTFFDGLVCSMNPYPKAWAYRVRRAIQGWDGPTWYPTAAVIVVNGIHAMNPAHIIMECLTNRDWGRGWPRSMIDDAGFRLVADALVAEGFGLCLRWNRRDNIDVFVQSVIDHIGAATYIDRGTGLYSLKLIRADYDANGLPIMTADSGLLEIRDCSTMAMTSAVNEVVVSWVDPRTNNTSEVRVHNLASYRNNAGVTSERMSYPGLPSEELALRIAQRDLKAKSIGLRTFEIVCDRRAWRLQPGSVFKIQDYRRGLGTIIVRVASAQDGTLVDGRITITAIQDVFGFPLTSYVEVEEPKWEPPDTKPQIGRRLVMEMPYVDIRQTWPRAEFEMIPESAGYICVAAEQPTPMSLAYDLGVQPGKTGEYIIRGSGDFAPVGDLGDIIDYFTTIIPLKEFKLWEFVEVGDPVSVGPEIMRVEEVYPDRVVVSRGAADTRPHRHATGTPAWFYSSGMGSDWVEYGAGETMNVKVLTKTTQGRLPVNVAPANPLAMDWRFYRPYLPGRALANGIPWFNPSILSRNQQVLTLTWTYRDRPAQEDQLVPHDVGSIGPEPGTQHRVVVRDQHNTIIRDTGGMATDTWSYTWAQAVQDMGIITSASGQEYPITITLFSQRDGLVSWQNYVHLCRVLDAEFWIEAT